MDFHPEQSDTIANLNLQKSYWNKLKADYNNICVVPLEVFVCEADTCDQVHLESKMQIFAAADLLHKH